MKPGLVLLVVIWMVAAASSASAGSLCKGPAPRPGAAIHGPVLQVDDGSSLCIAQGASPTQWSLVRLAQVRTTRTALMAAAFGRNATCRIGQTGLATCDVEGRGLIASLAHPEMAQAAPAWR